jgi:predicted AAA+ superfamily ATPase
MWGARQTGKSTLLKQLYPGALWFDLLMSDVYRRLVNQPELLRQLVLANGKDGVVVIDEIQRIPELLNEVHWLMSNTKVQFVMSGSSARKILRSGANLLGGRALRYELLPLVSPEVTDFDLLRALNHGLLPRHYTVENPNKLIASYIGNYLRDEIVNEARLRNVQVFSQFLEAAAFSNGEMVNYSNIAADCGVSAPTVKEYFQILNDTLLGRFVPSYQKKPKRRVIAAPKFYFFDVGVANHLLKRGKIVPGTEHFGSAFEHFIYQELYAHSSYSGLDYRISYWRTASQIEIDFVLGDNEVAIEVKGSSNVSERHLKGLKSFMEEYTVKHAILVCNESMPRKYGNIWILPWNIFLQNLWAGAYVS